MMKKIIFVLLAVLILAVGANAEVRPMETPGNTDGIERIICRLFGGKNKDFSTATKPLAGYRVKDASGKSNAATVMRGYPVEFKKQPPPLGQEMPDKSRMPRISVLDFGGKLSYMINISNGKTAHIWTIDSKTFYPAFVAVKMELGAFPNIEEWNLTTWNYNKLELIPGKRVESDSTYLPSKPFDWGKGGIKATFSGVSGEFTIEKSGVFSVLRSAIDSQLSVELQRQGVKASGTVSQTEIVVSCLARRYSAGKNGLNPESVAATLDFLRDTQLNPDYKVILPTVINYCLTEQ